jgi:hypothetical protein
MKDKITHITLPLIDYGILSTRIIAQSGKDEFTKYVHEPLFMAGWVGQQQNENSKSLMKKILRYDEPSTFHTIAPLCRRLISLAMIESLKHLENACIFFFDKMRFTPTIAESKEALELCNTLYPEFKNFELKKWENSSFEFETRLHGLSKKQLKGTIESIRSPNNMETVSKEKTLHNKIITALKHDNKARCQQLLSSYFIQFTDQKNINTQHIEHLIDTLNKKFKNFREDLYESIAIILYYDILAGIMENDLKRTIIAIRKYTIIFKGNPNIVHFMKIDALEKKLYKIIDEKNLWNSLSKDLSESL